MGENERALLEAAEAGSMEGIEAALASGAGIDCQGPEGRTALMLAVRAGHPAAASTLIFRGADASIANDYGATPVDACFALRDAQTLHALAAHGALPTGFNDVVGAFQSVIGRGDPQFLAQGLEALCVAAWSKPDSVAGAALAVAVGFAAKASEPVPDFARKAIMDRFKKSRPSRTFQRTQGKPLRSPRH